MKTLPDCDGCALLPPMKRAMVVVGFLGCSSRLLSPITDHVTTTTEHTLRPTLARQVPSGPNPAQNGQELSHYTALGFGASAAQGGEGYITQVIDGSTPPPPGANVQRVVRFAHLTDLQLSDDESPTRLAAFDAPTETDAAARTQDPDLCAMVNAAVRTINGLNREDPIAFTLLGGDNADSSQENEVTWALQILSGAKNVKCDSGAPNDLVPGPNNDGKDAFDAEGLDMPFKWITGNHDVEVQGTFANSTYVGISTGTVAATGTRDYSQPGGPIRSGDFVVADPARALLDRHALMKKVAADGDGHGIAAAQIATGKAFYSYDVPGTPLRLIALDTPTDTGGAEAIILQGDVDTIIKPLLDQALADRKWVFLASHHPTDAITADGGTFGVTQPDAITSDAWIELIGSYPNVIFSMIGHVHQHHVNAITPINGHAWWELWTSALADFPHQFRVVELFDEDNGWLMLRGTAVDYSTENDPVALDARQRSLVDFQSGWGKGTGAGTPADRNVELWMKKPVLQ